MQMAPSCVYDCAHPLWNGDGTCSTNNDDEAICVCSPGYASKDALGKPSCVPTKVLWSFYLIGSLCGAATTLFLVWHIVKYFDAPASVRRTRKATLRFQILTASSIVTGGVAVGCTVIAFHGGNDMAGGEANLWDFYIIQALFVFVAPPMVYTFPLMIEYWLLGLPSQFLRSNGVAVKAKELASSHRIFPRTGVFLGALVSTFGAIAFSGSRWALLPAEMVLMISTDLGGMGMGVVGFEMVSAINLAEDAVTGKKDGFYGRAKRRIRAQVFGCWFALVINTIAVITLFFTHIGRGTPVIPMCFHFCCGLAICCPFAHLTAFAGGVGRGGESKAAPMPKPQQCSTSTPFRPTVTSMVATPFGQLGRSLKQQKVTDQQDSQHGIDTTKAATLLPAPPPASGPTLPRVGEQPWRVVPVVDDDDV